VAEELSACQEGIGSMELVILFSFCFFCLHASWLVGWLDGWLVG
jgi:hypothetical protein